MSSTSTSFHTKMSKTKLTILCDLDDTLLKNDFNIFLPAYLKTFSKEVSLLPENVFVPNLLSGTEKMISNQDPTATLQEIFDRSFFSAVELDKSILEPIINQFYGEVFQTLQPLTAPFVESKKLGRIRSKKPLSYRNCHQSTVSIYSHSTAIRLG